MGRWLVTIGAALALLAVGCSQATTPGDSGTGSGDSGADGGVALSDTGIDAAALADTGVDAGPGPADAGTDAPNDAARGDAGMCVDLPPDPTRPTPVQCSACRPPSGTSSTTGGCMSDADCSDNTMGSNGRCVFGRIGTFCDYDTCFADTDCAAGEVCLCDGSSGGGNTCVPSNCRVDADCAGGRACSPTFGMCGHYSGFVAFRCHTATDACTVDADCAAPGYCAFDEITGHWACSMFECAG